jgi:hypothetical protein
MEENPKAAVALVRAFVDKHRRSTSCSPASIVPAVGARFSLTARCARVTPITTPAVAILSYMVGYDDELGEVLAMSRACLIRIRFRCSAAKLLALYQVVKTQADPETVDPQIAWVCNGPLAAREGQFV